MDKGAHFFRCDFQVHTPRDPQWNGDIPSTEEEREKFAENLVLACRAKGLDAIAVTDHHDFAFFAYVKKAAANEQSENGIAVPDSSQLTVFPGMELTLAVPCQAILIFDANLPPDFLQTVYGALAISPTHSCEPQCPQAVQLQNITTLSEVHRRLDEHQHLQNRFILLPHVSDGGHKTLLRSNFQAKYIEMPCVGGYLDGSITKMGDGVTRITDGKDRNYGFKRIGVFQTSDSRRGDFRDLGKHSTWVKWAEPTAEALRQACLARDTRISHSEPETPSLWIKHIEVSQSRFMGPIDLALNRQYNSLIGGRGTGKSTVLEYLRWALCDQPVASSSDDELPDYQSKRTKLISHTLKDLESVVTVTLDVNGVEHTIRRKAKDGRVALKVGSGEFTERTEGEIQSLLPVQAYSQKQLSSVAVRADELIRFVQSPIKSQLEEFEEKESAIRADVREHYGKLRAARGLNRQIEREELELDSLSQQETQLRGLLKGLDEDDQKVLKEHETFVEDNELIEGWQRDIEAVNRIVVSAREEISQIAKRTPKNQGPNSALLQDIAASFSSLVSEIDGRLKAMEQETISDGGPQAALSHKLEKWEKLSKEHESRYEEAKQKASSQEKVLHQIKEVESRAKALRQSLGKKRDELGKKGDPEADYLKARTNWLSLFRERAEAVSTKCDELTALSGGRIRASLRRGTGTEAAKRKLESIVSGTRIRAKKIESLFEAVASSQNPSEVWEHLLTDLEKLAVLEVTEDDEVELPSLHAVTVEEFGKSDLVKLANKVNLDDWLELSLTELVDIPDFEYAQRDGDYIPFASASAGQQATALLRVLLRQGGPPLIVDQPEEDLDNQVILEIVRDIWNAKKHRQVVFSSHNANVVVNGDADLVICCDYRTAGDQSGGRIKCEGAIDVEAIRQEVTTVMEGGREAFRLRRDKYGF